MSKRSASFGLVVSALILATVDSTAGTCQPVSGKITNNFASETSTLGVIEMNYGTQGQKLKCALSGQERTSVPGAIDFIHSISCSDAIKARAYDEAGNVPVHSSIVLHTTGTVSPPQLPTQLFTFKETSTPILTAPARGLFAGVTGGLIEVDGAVYKGTDGPYGSIDMSFKGEVCY